MNEIEKLYELVGLSNMWVEEYLFYNVDTIRMYYSSYNEMIKSMMRKNDWSRSEAVEVAKKECRKGHPPFTAEKELKLIKWFVRSKHFSHETDYIPWILDDIASYIVYLWDIFSDIERQQIKEILK